MNTQFGFGYGIVDYSILRIAVFNTLYSPYASFRVLAEALKDLEAGNGTKVLDILKSEKKFECKCGDDTPNAQLEASYLAVAVYCGDGIEKNEGPAELYDRYWEMYEEFGSFADVSIGTSAACVHVFSPI